MQINMLEAKTQLSKLIERALAGEEIVIARAGKPTVKLVPVVQVPDRKPGRLRGKGWIADDFDAPLAQDQQTLWYEKSLFPTNDLNASAERDN